VQKSQTNTRVLNNNPTRINILNKCDKKVLCVYIGTREIVYRCLPTVAKEALGSDKTVTINI
jgi:anaerobic C4-dicarboxylate transporter